MFTAVFVADGAGSAKHSDLGAQTAVNAAKNNVSNHLEQCNRPNPADYKLVLEEAFHAAQLSLLAIAQENNLELQQLSCTLIGVILLADEVYISQIGDGAVVIVNAGDEFQTLSKPQHGEYINQTTFINSEHAFIQSEHYDGPVKGLAVFSDGIEQLALQHPTYQPFVPFFRPLMRFTVSPSADSTKAAQLHRFLQSKKVSDRTSDDITLVLAVRPDFV